MSGVTELTVGGAWNGTAGAPGSGIVSIPSAFAGGVGTPGINQFLQQYLYNVAGSIVGGSFSLENADIAAGLTTSSSGTGAGIFEEFTNVSGTGVVTGTSVSGSTAGNPFTVANLVTDLVVQAPGSATLHGASSTSIALFGANSNVDYSVTDPVAGSIYLAGGANSVTLFATSTNNAETVYSAGSDTVNFQGNGSDVASVFGNSTIEIQAANATVTALNAASTNVYWDGKNSGGTLDFINNSSGAATINIGIFAGLADSAHVTAFGGAGGGEYVGGAAGANSLVGGTGTVTLVGGGDGDYLQASSTVAGSENFLFAGAGAESLFATAATFKNTFQVGLNYPGLGQPAGSGVISTAGSGQQSFFLGKSPGESIYASTNTGANFNVFNFVSDATAGGGTFDIYNFTTQNSVMYLVNGTDNGAGSATITSIYAAPGVSGQTDIQLSDNTLIRLHGFSGSLATTTGSIGQIVIY